MEARLMEEYKQLVERITRLEFFISRVQEGQIANVDNKEFDMMNAQLEYMCRYRDVLQDRIITIMIKTK